MPTDRATTSPIIRNNLFETISRISFRKPVLGIWAGEAIGVTFEEAAGLCLRRNTACFFFMMRSKKNSFYGPVNNFCMKLPGLFRILDSIYPVFSFATQTYASD